MDNLYNVVIINSSFSTKVHWLKVAPTNRDPAVILGYYLECVATLGGKLRLYIIVGDATQLYYYIIILWQLYHGLF